jgi:hypothetical protein
VIILRGLGIRRTAFGIDGAAEALALAASAALLMACVRLSVCWISAGLTGPSMR